MSRSLPLHPSVEQLRKKAKDLQRAVVEGDEDALARIAGYLSRRDDARGFALSQAQLVIAREHGFASWPQLKRALEEPSEANGPERVSRARVARYVLQVEFSKLTRPPFDPASEKDMGKLAEAVAQYHDGPRNSPMHLYAAITDARLEWYRLQVPVDKLLMGPGEGDVHADLARQAGGFVASFARLLSEHAKHPGIAPYLITKPVAFPIVPTVLVDYRNATPWLPEPKANHGDVYRLLDGYHRSVAMILQGLATVCSHVGTIEDRSPWRGNYDHLDRWDGKRWIPKAALHMNRS